MKQTLTAIILTYNEAHRLRPCLESVRWANEIVVVDSGSTDRTLEIAHEFTPHVHFSGLLGPDKPGGFSDQRNFGLAQATGEWVLFLDADERVTLELAKEIQGRILGNSPENHTAYRLRRREHFFGVYSPYTHGQAWQTRLLRRGSGAWDGRLVHEGLTHRGTLGDLQGYIQHFSKDTVAEYVTTMNKYTSLEAEEFSRSGGKLAPSPWPGMIRAFCYRYVHMKSYREGQLGLLMSLMFAFYCFLSWAKQWEVCKNSAPASTQTQPSRLTASVAGGLSLLWHGAGTIKRRSPRLRKMP